ncbi:hypothetical protein FACS1894201_06550 [Bacteroidia bacterium]|nr:hypothetical protein FACS1894201_06550 [Bacteroidia bacterium]
MEYRCVDTATRRQIFYQGPFKDGTNNIGEFLALVHAIALLSQQGQPKLPIYTDSVTALAWVRNKKAKTKLELTANNGILFELIQRAEIRMDVNDSEGHTYSYVFSQKGSSYQLNMGHLPIGVYHYAATTKNGNSTYQVKGNFRVNQTDIEANDLYANHQVLSTLSAIFDAQMYYPQQINQLVDDLSRRDESKPTVFIEKNYLEIINLKYLLLFIIALLSAEWILRRSWGIH